MRFDAQKLVKVPNRPRNTSKRKYQQFDFLHIMTKKYSTLKSLEKTYAGSE